MLIHVVGMLLAEEVEWSGLNFHGRGMNASGRAIWNSGSYDGHLDESGAIDMPWTLSKGLASGRRKLWRRRCWSGCIVRSNGGGRAIWFRCSGSTK